jgi:hypothetical protein
LAYTLPLPLPVCQNLAVRHHPYPFPAYPASLCWLLWLICCVVSFIFGSSEGL